MDIGCIIRSILRPVVNVTDHGSCFVLSDPDHDVPWDGAGAGIFCFPRDIPEHAKTLRLLGNLTAAWWPRATEAESRRRMTINFSKPLTPESAAELARSLEALRGANGST